MKVLWITNIVLPPAVKAAGGKGTCFEGWLYSSLRKLSADKDYEFAVATVYKGKKVKRVEAEGVTYYLLPLQGKPETEYNQHLEEYWRQVNVEFKPDVVHIHGSEFPHGLAWINACGGDKTAVSIQGLVSVCAKYFLHGLTERECKVKTFRDILKRDSLRDKQKNFFARGARERLLLSRVSDIIGRTEWDKAHAWAINPEAHYHYCGETLRPSFYRNKWSYADCEPYSIFVSQASYPIKGLHKLLEAMRLVIREYPDVKIRVAGNDILNKPNWKISGYGKILADRIREYGLEGRVEFTGQLDEEGMLQEYLKANVFVLPSAIENSPNSLGEAQMLGMPFVASVCGGTPEIVGEATDALYRFDESEMLAKKICGIFAMRENFSPKDFDEERYSGDRNASLLKDIYKEIKAR